ncbi:MAG: hypothetical protein SNJ78_01795 [Spirochaetales bacterium]
MYHSLGVFIKKIALTLSISSIGFSLISLQVLLMRFFAETKHHHVSFFIVGIALLGIGASGTFLKLFYDSLSERMELWVGVGFALFSLLVVIFLPLAESLPIDYTYFVFYPVQLLYFILYIFILFLVFFLGGGITAAILEQNSEDIPLLYGTNLFASALGGVVPLFFLYGFPVEQLIPLVSLVGILGGFFWIFSVTSFYRNWIGKAWAASSSLVVMLLFLPWKPSLPPYKPIFVFHTLEKSGQAELIDQFRTPRGTYSLYRSSVAHYAPFIGLTADSPLAPQWFIFKDGELVGTLLDIASKEEARVLDTTPQSIPYRLVKNPRVLLLDESGGINLWIAERFHASAITLVVKDPEVASILKHYISRIPLTIPLELVTEDPRLFLERSQGRSFDLIQIVSTETLPATTSGLLSPRENFLLTIEGLKSALSLLSKEGILCITRGLQSPPRDSFRLLSMAREAISLRGKGNPQDLVLLARNYLAFLLILCNSPPSSERISNFLSLVKELGMDAEYYPGVKESDILPYQNRVPAPPGLPYSYYFWGAQNLLQDTPVPFSWLYDITPSTDSRPYFHNFFSWRGAYQIYSSVGLQGMKQLELGYLIIQLTALCMGVVAIPLLIIALKGRKQYPAPGKKFTVLYFTMVGFAFLFLEIAWMASLQRLLGDSLITASLVLTGLLFSAGLGSFASRKVQVKVEKELIRAALWICLYLGLSQLMLPSLTHYGAFVSNFFRYTVGAAFILLPGYWMGRFFPLGIRIVRRHSISLIPVAWASNGFASVLAAPIAQMMAMSWGFFTVAILAGSLYLLAAWYSFLHGIKRMLYENRSP